ncbi:hypothetical protein DFS34DRAFT_16521 [Phlyctochytrium arcticum]|nr:hypothetical protein DFS34DRAFT_16521 [Phlyctochytrium arcticum]
MTTTQPTIPTNGGGGSGGTSASGEAAGAGRRRAPTATSPATAPSEPPNTKPPSSAVPGTPNTSHPPFSQHQPPQQHQAQAQTKPQNEVAPSRHSSNVSVNGSTSSGSSPIPSMHWSKIPLRGTHCPPPLRAHTTTVVGGSKLYVFGGCDAKACYSDLYIFDTEALWWTRPTTYGDKPKTVRAHSAALVANRYLVVFGGGDGPLYYNTLYILDTKTLTWYAPQSCVITPGSIGEDGNTSTVPGGPSARRAHTSWVYNDNVYVYAGGDGVRALSDLYVLHTAQNFHPPFKTPVEWQLLQTTGGPIATPSSGSTPAVTAPANRGYHTSTPVQNTPLVLLFGGSDGHECFSDVQILNVRTLTWTPAPLDRAFPRLSHTATQVGSYLFVLGGHDGTRYGNEALLLNLVTMNWETRTVYGKERPEGRGYHTTCLVDSRLWMFGGYDGARVYGDLWALELSASAYLPQITAFEVGGVGYTPPPPQQHQIRSQRQQPPAGAVTGRQSTTVAGGFVTGASGPQTPMNNIPDRS